MKVGIDELVMLVGLMLGEVEVGEDGGRLGQPSGGCASGTIKALVKMHASAAAESVLKNICLDRLVGCGVELRSPVYVRKDGTGFMCLPPDFMRLLEFRMSDWERNGIILGEEPKASDRLLWRGEEGIKANSTFPVVCVVPRDGCNILEFAGSKDLNSEVAMARFLPLPMFDKEYFIEIPDLCVMEVVTEIAKRIKSGEGNRVC